MTEIERMKQKEGALDTRRYLGLGENTWIEGAFFHVRVDEVTGLQQVKAIVTIYLPCDEKGLLSPVFRLAPLTLMNRVLNSNWGSPEVRSGSRYRVISFEDYATTDGDSFIVHIRDDLASEIDAIEQAIPEQKLFLKKVESAWILQELAEGFKRGDLK